MDPITQATHEWAAEKVGTPVSNVKAVEFTTGGSDCETCGYTTAAVEVALVRGRSKLHEFEWGESFVDIIRDISARVKP